MEGDIIRHGMKFAWPILLLALSSALSASAPPAAAGSEFHRGMVVSCPRWGPIWGSEAMEEALSELKGLGVDSVAIHPYGWVKTDGRIEFRPAGELDFLEKAVDLADEAGVRLFWKPHLGYWGQFEWRGTIEFGEDEGAWRRFFADYERFIVDQARFAAAQRVDLFAVGVELEATTHREKEWRQVIERVRSVFSGKVVYAANWDRLGDVPFWDAVDWLGVHAYFPLSDIDDPGEKELAAGWEPHLEELGQLSEQHKKPVLIAEIGYNISPAAARTPWVYETEDSVDARELRRRLMRVAIEELSSADFVRGMYWWKWMPGSTYRRRNFSMRDPEVIALLEGLWGGEPAAVVTGR